MISKKEFEEIVEDFLNGFRTGGGIIANSVENLMRACDMNPEICVDVVKRYKEGDSIDSLVEYLRGVVGDKKAYRLVGYKGVTRGEYNKIMDLFCYIVDVYAR